MVLDETAELKKGDRTVGVGRQHAGITGQVDYRRPLTLAFHPGCSAGGALIVKGAPELGR